MESKKVLESLKTKQASVFYNELIEKENKDQKFIEVVNDIWLDLENSNILYEAEELILPNQKNEEETELLCSRVGDYFRFLGFDVTEKVLEKLPPIYVITLSFNKVTTNKKDGNDKDGNDKDGNDKDNKKDVNLKIEENIAAQDKIKQTKDYVKRVRIWLRIDGYEK